jgi:hypothetical protein
MGSKYQRFSAFVAALSLTMLLGAAPTAQAAWQISSEDGSNSIKFGFLAKLRGESIDPPTGSAEQNLFFRRLRILAGGKLNDKWSFFFETDSPNLGKGSGASKSGDIFIQDFVVTYKPKSDKFMLDFGQLLAAVTYNSNQSAVSLLATDYQPTSFVWAGALDTKVGRDYGVRARGYLMNDKLEYRASLLSGNRGADSTNSFRFFGRVMYNFFDPMKGLFYKGRRWARTSTCLSARASTRRRIIRRRASISSSTSRSAAMPLRYRAAGAASTAKTSCPFPSRTT